MEVSTLLLSPISRPNTLAIQSHTGLLLEPIKNSVEIYQDADPITKEEEVIKKKKTELTTTKQIETRVKRQVVLEDGKVVQDSGPVVETNTTEDTDKKESNTVENYKSGDDKDKEAIENVGSSIRNISKIGATKLYNNRDDGLVRETKTTRAFSREEIDDILETEGVQHYGDFSDEAYINAVNHGRAIKTILISPNERQLVRSRPPRIIHQSTKAHKTIDTENTNLRCLAKPDGTLVTEKENTTEHEEIVDEDLPEKDVGNFVENDYRKESSQRFSKQRDEQAIEYIADGKTIGKKIIYAAETEQMNRDGSPPKSSDWDNFSDRLKKTLQNKCKSTANERKPALTTGSRTDLDDDEDDRTRKGETIKWLENHFGSESRSSKDDDFEETKKSYFNVTIKSNPSSLLSPSPAAYSSTMPTGKKYHQTSDYNSNLISPSKVIIPERETSTMTNNKLSKNGINDWHTSTTEHREYNRNTVSPINRFTDHSDRIKHRDSTSPSPQKIVHYKVVRDDIPSSTTKLNRMYNSKSDLRYQRSNDDRQHTDHYAHSLKRDAKHRSESREQLYSSKTRRENNDLYRSDSPAGYVGNNRLREESISRIHQQDIGAKNDRLLYEPKFKKTSVQRNDSNYSNAPKSPKLYHNRMQSVGSINENSRETTPVNFDSDYVRPSVPQRRRILERKLQLNAMGPISNKQQEPAPDYNHSSPSRSRSHSPVLHTTSAGHKRYQRARFASEPARSIVTKTDSIHESPKNKSASSLSLKSSRVGSAISNSIRKFFGKIRSASSGRKLKLKPKRSIASSSDIQPSRTSDFGSTYQQYYVIDGHIGNGKATSVASNRSKSDRSRVQSESEPKKKYYLGEDPYGGGTYGKENKYDGTKGQSNAGHHSSRRSQSNDVDRSSALRTQHQPIDNMTLPSNLKRYSKSMNRLASPSHATQNDYTTTQTLPRKLDHHKPLHSSTINVSFANVSSPTNKSPPQNTGPEKPARTYNKALNRSKSFNVHGFNANDPNPIHIDNRHRNLSRFVSNPHLSETKPELKSPSIVNLISQSQRDLTKIDRDPKPSLSSRYNNNRI